MVLAILFMAYLAVRGFLEGIIMIRYTDPMCDPNTPDDMDGVRCHRWFKWYHPISLGCDIFAGILGALAVWRGIEWIAAAGAVIAGWELLEVSYNLARYGKPFQSHENFLGVWQIKGGMVYYIHSARLLIGIALFIGGVIL